MEEEYVKIWKKHKITRAEFSFNCGNDDIGDTDIIFYKGDKVIKEKWGMSSYFTNDIFQEVEFYEHGDGEYGIVTIELNEDEDGFYYSKSSKTTRIVEEGEDIFLEITQEQAQFLKEYVSNMSGGNHGREHNYKKDFILTKEIEEMIEELCDNFEERCHGWADDLIRTEEDIVEFDGGDYAYETGDITIIKKDGKFYVKLTVFYEFLIEEEN